MAVFMQQKRNRIIKIKHFRIITQVHWDKMYIRVNANSEESDQPARRGAGWSEPFLFALVSPVETVMWNIKT